MFKTSQEVIWSGSFGNKYTHRNQSNQLLGSSIALFSKILSRTDGVHTVMEFGANIGINLRAIKQLLPDVKLSALEINLNAVKLLKKIKGINIYPESILDFKPSLKHDFVFTRGLLIHLSPEFLKDAYANIYRSSKKYICIAEYYNPSPIEVDYRNQKSSLFKRDFAGELLERYPKLKLVDYGFAYHRDPNFPQDDISWFLMEICK